MTNRVKRKMKKNTHQNILVLIFALCFFSFNFASAEGSAQTKTAAKPTPPPKAKKSPTTVKPTPKPTPKTSTNSKPAKTAADSKTNIKKTTEGKSSAAQKSPTVSKNKTVDAKSAASKPSSQIIISVTSARVRSQPSTNSAVLDTLNIGTVLTVLDDNAAWYQVKLPDNKSGWIAKTIASSFDSAKRSETYQKIAAKYFKNNNLSFADASQIFDFLKSAPTGSSDLLADLQFKRLLALGAALKKIPFGKADRNPYRDFVKANEDKAVYSEPAGEWYVRAKVFWELHHQYKNLPISEEFAWQAAQTPLPGECEGYVNCYLYNIRATDGEYLNFYPGGKYSKKALQNITFYFEPIIGDLKEKAVYTAASDFSDRADFNRYLAELRKIISKVPYVEKAKTLKQINQLGEGYR